MLNIHNNKKCVQMQLCFIEFVGQGAGWGIHMGMLSRFWFPISLSNIIMWELLNYLILLSSAKCIVYLHSAGGLVHHIHLHGPPILLVVLTRPESNKTKPCVGSTTQQRLTAYLHLGHVSLFSFPLLPSPALYYTPAPVPQPHYPLPHFKHYSA